MEVPRADREILSGVIDLHVHAGPCLFEKLFEEDDLARQCRNIGYDGILFKSHVMNADHIPFVRKLVSGIQVFGGVCLNYFVGGLNPHAVGAALAFGAKEVKMPAMHAAHHIKVYGRAGWTHIRPKPEFESLKKPKTKVAGGISIFKEDGRLVPEVYEILDHIASADIILSTGHISSKESFALVEAAKNAGVKKILVTHPDAPFMQYSIEDQLKMAKMGAYLEKTIATSLPMGVRRPQSEKPIEMCDDLHVMAELIKKVGANKCVMSTDLGQGYLINPIEGMRLFIQTMRRYGVREREIDIMTKENPAKLLGI